MGPPVEWHVASPTVPIFFGNNETIREIVG